MMRYENNCVQLSSLKEIKCIMLVILCGKVNEEKTLRMERIVGNARMLHCESYVEY